MLRTQPVNRFLSASAVITVAMNPIRNFLYLTKSVDLMERRQFIIAAGSVSFLAIAGCVEEGADDEQTDSADTSPEADTNDTETADSDADERDADDEETGDYDTDDEEAGDYDGDEQSESTDDGDADGEEDETETEENGEEDTEDDPDDEGDDSDQEDESDDGEEVGTGQQLEIVNPVESISPPGPLELTVATRFEEGTELDYQIQTQSGDDPPMFMPGEIEVGEDGSATDEVDIELDEHVGNEFTIDVRRVESPDPSDSVTVPVEE